MRAFTYFAYIVFWELLCLGGSIYLVVWRNRSGWWIVLGLIMSASAYKPTAWIHGIPPKDPEE